MSHSITPMDRYLQNIPSCLKIGGWTVTLFMHKIITCTGFGGTGSSAISDLFKEFDNVKSCGDFEFSLAHEVDGISDLQHSIVDDFHRNKTTEAIFRFKKLIKIISGNYSNFFGKNFNSITDRYISNIVETEWMGFWHQHSYRGSRFRMYTRYVLPFIVQHYIHYLFNKSGYGWAPKQHRELMQLSRDKDRFFIATRNYYNELFNELDPDHNFEYLMLDQLVPSYNYSRYLNYFDNLKVIQVDRDPRDLYLLNELYWHEGWIPSENIDTYIKWYRLLRQNNELDCNKNVLKLHFEDIILNYDETLKEILEFTGIDQKNHINKRRFLDPNNSQKNLHLWKRHYKPQLDVIENALKDYLYE